MTNDKKRNPATPKMAPEEKLELGSVVAIRAMPPTLQGTTEEDRAAMEKVLVRKLDLRLMPMLVLVYIMNYLDRYLLFIL